MSKKLIYLVVSFLLVLAAGGVAHAAGWEAAISGADPLHWYRLDETGAECIDSGSAGLNGTYSGVSLGQDGFIDAAAGFVRSENDVVDFAGATNLPGPWTVEYVVKTTKAAAAQEAQALHDGGATSIRLAGWTALGEAGFTQYGVADYQFTPAAGLTLEDLIVQPDVWMHLVWRNDGSGMQLFFNGELVGTSTNTIDLPRLRIGTHGGSDGFDGVLDEAVVFDKALSDLDIQDHYAAATGATPRGKAASPSPANGAMLEATWTTLGWSPGGFAASHDVYLGDDYQDVDEASRDSDLFRGNQMATFFVAGFPGFAYPDGLVPGATYYWRIDEVNDADPNSPWKGDVWSFNIPPKTAYFPDPADAGEAVVVNASLKWTPGFGAKLHTVYFGDNFDEVSNAAGGPPQGTASYSPGELKQAKTYYWRVDEFDAIETYKGNVWSFTTEGAVAALNPANGAVDVTQTPVLTWAPGLGASHEVYFGTDAGSLENKASGNLGSESYDPGQLEWSTIYYWRIDEANNTNANSPWTGPLWSFTTANFLIIDDMESYNDINEGEPGSNRIYNAWVDGFDDPLNGSTVGHLDPPFYEETIVHSGNKSMPFTYNNAVGKSEATLNLTSNNDWTVKGVDRLTIWYRGGSANAAEQMYVVLNGTAAVTNDNPNAAQASTWIQWNIDLQAFADQGVNLANVNSITIGLSSGTGGIGTMYFDDIRLYAP